MYAHQTTIDHHQTGVAMTNNNNQVINLAQRSAEMEQRHWLVNHCDGDQTAFPKLIQWLRKPIYGYLIRCGVKPDSCDDLFQDIFLKIHAAASTYQANRPLKPWVFTIAANTVRNHFRTENKRRTIPIDKTIESQPDPSPSIEQNVSTTETTAWLTQAITQLPLAQREVLVLTTIQGLQLKDTASILRIPLNTVKTHLRRARLTLLKARTERDQEEIST